MIVLRDMSIGRKVTVIILSVTAVSLLLACSVMVSYDLVVYRRAIVTNASTLADMVADNSTAALTFGDEKSAPDVLRSLRTQPHITAACLYTLDGKTFAIYLRDKDSSFSPPPPRPSGNFFENGRMLQFHTIRLGKDSIGTVYLESDFSEMRARLRTYPVAIALTIVISSVVAFLLARRLQSVVSGPILDLVQTTKRVSIERNYAIRCPVTSEDEIGLLVAGCGIRYGFAGGGLPSNIRTMAVLPFDNQTTSPEVQRELLDAMRRELQRRLGVRDAAESRADAVVRGVISAYDADVPVAVSANPSQAVTARRRLQVTIDVEIVQQANGRVLFQRKGMRGEGDYDERAEPEGRRKAIEKIVNDIVEGAQSQW